ncbi:hypothetical protein SDJN02_07089 [Cucurbita argyrosperma subsp. argyrosperma]|nr:hypothetical protein SDJN02_07089 [Cucurbita argyrosperma subsp. argyrosperma]
MPPYLDDQLFGLFYVCVCVCAQDDDNWVGIPIHLVLPTTFNSACFPRLACLYLT